MTGRNGLHWRLFTENSYFFVESTLAFRLSLAAAEAESAAVLVESTEGVIVLSVFTAAESVFVSELEEPLQAAKEPIAKTNNNFFIAICLFVNYLMLIHGFENSNPPELPKS